MNRYNFYQADWPSIADVRTRLDQDATLPDDERVALPANIDWLLWGLAGIERFNRVRPEDIPFAWPALEGIIREIQPCLKKSEVRSNRAGLYEIMDLYGLRGTPMPAPIDAEWLGLYEQIDGHRARDLKRLFIFLSSNDVKPKAVTTAVSDAFKLTLMRDPAVEHWERAWVQALRDWNWARNKPVFGWPDIVWELPNNRDAPKYLPWSAYRKGLVDEVREALRRKPRFITWDENIDTAIAVDPESLEHGVEAIRICIGALIGPDMPADEMQGIYDFVRPDRFVKAIDKLIEDEGGNVTRLVRTKLARLGALAKRSGTLSKSETEELEKRSKEYLYEHKSYLKQYPSRVQKILRSIDIYKTMQDLHDLPLRMYAGEPPAHVTRSFAAEMKEAAILALRVRTGITDVILKKLVWDKNFEEMDGDYVGCLKLVAPAELAGNKMEREWIIPKRFADVLRSFVAVYRPALDISGKSKFLFPSATAKPLTSTTISDGQTQFLRTRVNKKLTSSIVREIIKRIILDNDPYATEVLASVLGLKDADYVRGLAEPYQNDGDNIEYVSGHVVPDQGHRQLGSED